MTEDEEQEVAAIERLAGELEDYEVTEPDEDSEVQQGWP